METDMQEIRGKLQQQVINSCRKQQRTKLKVEMEVLRKQLKNIPKWTSERMETKFKDSMQRMKRKNEDKEIEQIQSKV